MIVDLRKRFPKYKIIESEDYALAENDIDRLYRLYVECKYGRVGIYNEVNYNVLIGNNPTLIKKLKLLGTLAILGDEEAVFHIHILKFKEMFKILKPIRCGSYVRG